jgi:hypothetical protein
VTWEATFGADLDPGALKNPVFLAVSGFLEAGGKRATPRTMTPLYGLRGGSEG